MKLFDARAELAKIENDEGTPASRANPANQAGGEAPRLAELAELAAPTPQNSKNEAAPVLSDMQEGPRGTSVAGVPVTWTGRVVSLDDWRRLSEWEKHGPNGRAWCGKRKRWTHEGD